MLRASSVPPLTRFSLHPRPLNLHTLLPGLVCIALCWQWEELYTSLPSVAWKPEVLEEGTQTGPEVLSSIPRILKKLCGIHKKTKGSRAQIGFGVEIRD